MSRKQDEESDRELVERARAGEADAFEALVRRHLRGAYAVALARTGESADAEDVTQDAFILALERLDECRDPTRFSAWLHQIVRNRASNYRRDERLRRGAPLSIVLDTPGGSHPAADAERAELRSRLETATGMLPEAQREVLLMHDLLGYKHREIADRLGLPEGTVRSHLFHARRGMRAHLGDHADRRR